MAVLQYAVLQIGGERFLAKVDQVKSIDKAEPILSVTDAPDFVVGSLNVLGQVVPAIDLTSRIGRMNELLQDRSEERRSILVNADDKDLALLVDGVEEVVSIDTLNISPMPTLYGAFQASYLVGVAKVNDQLFVVLDLETIISQEEIKQLKETSMDARTETA